jgi:Mannosylglycerate hydrolase MGH1-like glycoside hydrolase domain
MKDPDSHVLEALQSGSENSAEAATTPNGENKAMTNEEIRLRESDQRKKHWKRWGPYLSERAWGTVREDYSATGEAWDYFPHDHARSRAYRWNEDGIGGICDRHQNLCFALALWNEKDPILKERLFGLTGLEGNHGEDVKEYYYYIDSTPTHSYMKYVYKYPHAAFPYEELVRENRNRSKSQPEYELADTGVFHERRYFDVSIEYAKADTEDICIRIIAVNRGSEAAPIRLLPTLWFRNTWSWSDGIEPPILTGDETIIRAFSDEIGEYELCNEGQPELLFTNNETNLSRLYSVPNKSPYVKDAFNRHLIFGEADAVNPERTGTKAALHYGLLVPAESEVIIRLRLRKTSSHQAAAAFADFNEIFTERKREADEFYEALAPANLEDDTKAIQRQAFAGLLWSKQFYHFDVRHWLEGDSAFPKPPDARKSGRNSAWTHLFNADIISMPDKWEYPWYAAWDLAFHCVAFAHVDPGFAKEQLILMLREWYMHPNGQVPAYEWAFGDVNPPVHAWAALQVYRIEQKKNDGRGDRDFLERIFHKLLLNFTWWVNRKDVEGQNVFQGGFLGLDNIGVFDRSSVLPRGGHIEQSDGTSWMAMYSLDMLAIAMELAAADATYEDVASKFWEHFVYIARAMNDLDGDGISLWNEEDGLFYDVLHIPGGEHIPMRVRSMVGLIPLYAVQTLEPELLDAMPAFQRRLDWFIANRPDLTGNLACMRTEGKRERRLLSITDRRQLECILKTMLDEEEFLSSYGIRALSRRHLDQPYSLTIDGTEYAVKYEPGESSTGLFGGNSNWRGPIWMPVNYLLIQALRRFQKYYGDGLTVECPTGSGNYVTMDGAASEVSRRLLAIFQRDANGRRPVLAGNTLFESDPHWRDLIPFHEYFHGDTGAGVGASHQTGWTALVACLIQELSESEVALHSPAIPPAAFHS